ncbi:hypothetical protein NDU88_007388 [Pleurodeles waltl]|uniref:Uncharacterized protein n=1 Tax=Pleurodeles waltl TaxID=8319 RepID=A0AAV7VUB3_PLEWA|nr:hypothetical protein NDU88_007388 [Pleurodeles waltl]
MRASVAVPPSPGRHPAFSAPGLFKECGRIAPRSRPEFRDSQHSFRAVATASARLLRHTVASRAAPPPPGLLSDLQAHPGARTARPGIALPRLRPPPPRRRSSLWGPTTRPPQRAAPPPLSPFRGTSAPGRAEDATGPSAATPQATPATETVQSAGPLTGQGQPLHLRVARLLPEAKREDRPLLLLPLPGGRPRASLLFGPKQNPGGAGTIFRRSRESSGGSHYGPLRGRECCSTPPS